MLDNQEEAQRLRAAWRRLVFFVCSLEEVVVCYVKTRVCCCVQPVLLLLCAAVQAGPCGCLLLPSAGPQAMM